VRSIQKIVRRGGELSVSALSIKTVEITASDKRSVRINVYMSEKACLFQVDNVPMSKLYTTPLRNHVEIYAIVDNSYSKYYP
jgi:metal-dependent HD superfamily phosphatase/phosphodiesterase